MFSRPIAPDAELRLLEMRHAGELFRAVDQNRPHLRPWLPWVDHQSESHARDFIRAGLAAFSAGKELHAGLFVKGRLAGVCGLNAILHAHRRVEIGYWLGTKAEGRGLMTLAVSALLDHVFDELKFHKAVIRCAPENLRSRALPRRLGFTHEATLRDNEWLYDHFVDHEVWSMFTDVWKARKTSLPRPHDPKPRRRGRGAGG